MLVRVSDEFASSPSLGHLEVKSAQLKADNFEDLQDLFLCCLSKNSQKCRSANVLKVKTISLFWTENYDGKNNDILKNFF